MRSLVAVEFLSVDGYMAGRPGHEMEWVEAGFSPELESDLAQQYAQVGSFLMGGTTFTELSSYWPTAKSEKEPLRDRMNQLEKLVISKHADPARWAPARALRGDAVQLVRELKGSSGKEVMIIGSASLVQSLLRARLVDELRLLVFPVIVGGGKPLFPALEHPLSLQQDAEKAFPNGVRKLCYRLA